MTEGEERPDEEDDFQYDRADNGDHISWAEHPANQERAPYGIQMQWREVSGRLECISLRITVRDRYLAKPITAALLKQISVSDLLREAQADLIAGTQRPNPRWGSDQRHEEELVEAERLSHLKTARPGRPPSLDAAHYQKVANAVNSRAAGVTQTAAVQAAFTGPNSDSVCRKWIAAARRKGLIQ